jgi:ParB-like chromosome segregation protein Spo0J
VEPIQISFEHDSFRIMDGEKRWRACRKLGMRSIRAVIA